jgi:hypothetical protein
MLSAIARKSLPRFTNYAKDTASISTIFGNEYSTINKRGNDSLTNIISTAFNTPEDYIKETNVGPVITLNGDRTVTMIAEEAYSDLGATANGNETVTTDTSKLDTSAVGTYTVSYSATDSAGYTRVENRFVEVVAPSDWTPSYTTVSVTMTDNLQPSVISLSLGQKYVFDFSQTRGKDFKLSPDGTTELTDGVIEAKTTLVYTVPSNFNLPLYYYSPSTPNIGGYFWIYNVVYYDQGRLKIGGITSITRGQSYTFYFSSDYETSIALSTSLNGTNLTDGIITTDTSLSVTLPFYYPYSTIFIKSLDIPNIGSSLNVTGTRDTGTIYFDNGTLKAIGITSIIRGQAYAFYFSSDYGTAIALSVTEDGTTFTEGVTTTDTSLTFVVPGTYSPSTIYIKSPTTSGIGSSLTVSGTLETGTIYFENGTLKATGITSFTRGQTYTFYFSSDYGTTIRLSATEDGTDFTEGVITTDTSLTFVIPSDLPYNPIYIKSPTISGIGSSLTFSGTLDDGTIYFNNGTLKASGITSIILGSTYTFYFSSYYGTTIRLSATEDGTDFTEGVTTTDTSLTFVVPGTYQSNTIYIKSPTTSGIGSSITVPPYPSPEQTDNIPAMPVIINTVSTYAIVTGLYAYNDTRQVGNYTFDNRGASTPSSPRATSYPELIIQALPGDTITLTAGVVRSIGFGVVVVNFWYWFGDSWITFASQTLETTTGSQNHTKQLTIPSDIYGNFALGISIGGPGGLSYRSYSLHVINPN